MNTRDGAKKGDLTYPLYVKTVNDLKAQGQTISVRAVQRVIGGSNSTLLEYQRRWQAEAALATTVEDNISDSLKQSLLAEFGRRVQVTRERLETQLTQERQQLKEANELLAEAEGRQTELEAHCQTEQAQAAEKILTLEKQLAANQERIAELQHQIEKLEQHLKGSITAQEFARTEAAKFKLQLERADKDTEKAEKQAKELEARVVELQQRAHQAEIKAAVAEARVNELEKQTGKNK